MTKVLFICHGNICRSPMAEFVMKDLVDKAGLSDQFEIASAATSTEEIGNPVYPPARRKLAGHGICCAGKGYGRAFVEYYETYARENGCTELRIDTNARNEVARAMYKKHGYTEIGIVPTVFNVIEGVQLVLLEKYLGK